MGRNETNLDKLNRLAAQKYEEGVEGLHLFSKDFCELKNQLECLNIMLTNPKMVRCIIDVYYNDKQISKNDYQKLIALLEGIEVD